MFKKTLNETIDTRCNQKFMAYFLCNESVSPSVDAQHKGQVIGLPLAKAIELYPEVSAITRYWSIQLVYDNKAWISRLIIAAWTHTSRNFTQHSPVFVD